MTKEIHAYRVWAVRNGERTLEVRLDQPNGRRIAIERVTALRADPQVGEIEMRGALDAISAVLEDMGVQDRAPAPAA